jgi:LytS/YehU family sensor histidine kinase
VKYSGRDVLMGGLLIALALVLPVLFHALNLGSAFLPMFLPIVLAGYLLAPSVALAVGALAPLLSALLTGMPPFFPPIALIMMVEGLALAGIPALLYQKYRWNVYFTLLITLFVDRMVSLGLVVLSSHWLNLPEEAVGISLVLKGIPGIILIVAAIPPMVKFFEDKKKRSALILD